MIIRTNLVNIAQKSITAVNIFVENGFISQIEPTDEPCQNYAVQGFIDAHVHIESSMLIPSEFARLAVTHGTVASVSDPHEIANVLGVEGVKFMIENAKKTPFKCYFGVPSCVPATEFETAGASISPTDVQNLFEQENLLYLAEMMNWVGVLYNDPLVYEKIEIAKKLGKKIDGHAPALRGEDARKYIEAGISTDHECVSKEEALDKLKFGMKIIIREGSAAKNFEALIDLLHDYPEQIMFCSDDKHPDSLVENHIDELARRAVAKGIDVFKVLQAACLNPILHYGLEVGQLRVGDPADFILLEDLTNFKVLQTFIQGELVAENGKTLLLSQKCKAINKFECSPKTSKHFEVVARSGTIRVIECIDGELITNESVHPAKIQNGNVVADPAFDILKIAVVNRYQDSEPAVAFIKNFGLKSGAIASTVAHDSHNIVVVGVNDEEICRAVNLLIQAKGGISAVNGKIEMLLPLPIAGLMSAEDGYLVAKKYTEMDKMAKLMGSALRSPYMSLSFMALLVIPNLKLSDKGLFDGKNFQFANLFI